MQIYSNVIYYFEDFVIRNTVVQLDFDLDIKIEKMGPFSCSFFLGHVPGPFFLCVIALVEIVASMTLFRLMFLASSLNRPHL